MFKVRVFGQASHTEIKIIELSNSDLDKSILELLQDNGIPIASSCMGEGICKKCVINDKILSCFKLTKEILNWDDPTIYIGYL